jgi:hypothetical protein
VAGKGPEVEVEVEVPPAVASASPAASAVVRPRGGRESLPLPLAVASCPCLAPLPASCRYAILAESAVYAPICKARTPADAAIPARRLGYPPPRPRPRSAAQRCNAFPVCGTNGHGPAAKTECVGWKRVRYVC